LNIADKPIPFDDQRVRRTLASRRPHIDREATEITIEPKGIVLHQTAGGTADGTFQYSSETAAHFLVDRDATIGRRTDRTLKGPP
jgi:hypothetical protein